MTKPMDRVYRSSPLARVLFACFALVAAACGHADAAEVTGEAPSALTLRWLKGDNHLHTRHSDGSGTPTQTANAAKSLGYGFATLTDHNTTAGNAEMESQSNSSFVGLGGEEVTRGDGHYLAFGITSTVSAGGTPQQMIDAVNANNPGTSFGYIAHPMWSTAMTQGGDWEWHDWSVTGYAGLEVWNAYYPHNYDTDYTLAAFSKWDELNRAGRHLYGMTNSDAHSSNVGNASGSSLGLGYGFNVVYAELSKASILAALKNGRFYGSNGPSIDFVIDGVMMGGDAPAPGGVVGRISLSASDSANITSVTLLKNGAVLQSFTPNSTSWSTTLSNVSATPGDFFRMTVEGPDRFAYSNPIFIAGTPFPRLTTSKSIFAANESITVNVLNNNGTGSPGAGGTATDWVALYEAGDTPGTSHAATRWAYLDGDQTAPDAPLESATITWAGLPQGSYFVAFFSGGSYVEVSPRLSLTVSAAAATPTLTLSKPAFTPTEAVSVSFANNYGAGSPAAGGTTTDWIGIYRAGDTPGSQNSTRWAYLDGDQTAPSSVIASGTVSLSALPAGAYFVGFFAANGYDEIAPRLSFFVSEPPYVSTNKSLYAVGETVTVSFGNNYGGGYPASGGSPSDWIAIYDSKGGNGHWAYLDGTQVCPLTTTRSGALSFTNFVPDTYTVRFLAYGSPDLDMQMAPSVSFQVVPSAPALFSDNFDDHAPGSTPDGWSTSAGSYSVVRDGTPMYQVDINKAAARFAYAGIPATRDMTVQSTLKVARYYGNHVANVGVVGRYVDAANTYVFYWTHAGDVWRLGKYVGGTWTTLASSASAPLGVGKAVTVRLVVSGSSLAGYVDGVLKVSATDSSLSSGKAGLYGWSVKSKFDDFSVSSP
jgi:hypothetical protein